MGTSFTEFEWDYWAALSYWTRLEAAFLLSGIIPSTPTKCEYGFYDGSSQQYLDPEVEGMMEILKRQFPGAKIDSQECIRWAIRLKIPIHTDLKKSLADFGNLDVTSASAEDTVSPQEKKRTGEHWSAMRYKVLQKALQTLNSAPKEYKLFHSKDGRINRSQLTDAIMDYGHDLTFDNGKMVGKETVYNTIREAIYGEDSSDIQS